MRARPERPAFVEVPVMGGASITATVANRDGLAEVLLNDVPHIGLLLSVNAASATIAVLEPEEALGIAQRLTLAALTLARRRGIDLNTPQPRMRRDVSGLAAITRLHADDYGSHQFEVLDEKGQPVTNVQEVNADEGWARVLLLDDDGAPQIENDGFVYVRVRGTYTIRRKET